MIRDSEGLREGSLEIEVDATHGFVWIRVRGRLPMRAAIEAQARAARGHPGRHRLWDFREADLSDWFRAELSSLVNSLGAQSAPAAGAGIRVGAIATRDVEFGISRMFESMASGALPMTFAVFRDEAAAVAWLVDAPPEAAPRGGPGR